MKAQSFPQNTVITAPCGAEGFDLVSSAAFSVQYFDFKDQIPTGDVFDAYKAGGGSDHVTTVWAPPGYAFIPGMKICVTSGGTAAIIAIPTRTGTR